MKFNRFTYTEHGLDRANNRLILGCKAVNEVLSKAKYVKVGEDKSSNREHLMFYSNYDRDFFIIVFDVKVFSVITVLPIEYHNKWNISDVQQKMAYDIIQPGYNDKEEVTKTAKVNSVDKVITETKQVSYSATILDYSFNFRYILNLGKVRVPVNTKLHSLLQDDELLDKIQSKLDKRVANKIKNDSNFFPDDAYVYSINLKNKGDSRSNVKQYLVNGPDVKRDITINTSVSA